MISRINLFLIVSLISLAGFSQEYNYVHYDPRDGLAGSTVYDMCQDIDGFLWFATENGVSRFDGYRFTNFTVKDGLPDNEILKLFADSKGRVWFGSLSKELSFYYKGTIHNKHNDSLLSKTNMLVNGFEFAEDKDSDFYVSDYKKLIKTDKYNQSLVLTDSPDFKMRPGRNVSVKTHINDKQAIIRMGDSTFELQGASLKLFYVSNISGKNMVGVKILPSGVPIHMKFIGTVLSETAKGPTNIFINTTDGAWSLDTNKIMLDQHFLPGKQVSNTIIDTEGDIWFSTLGNGVYKLPSTEMRTFNFTEVKGQKVMEVFSLAQSNGTIAAGLGFSKLAIVDKYRTRKIIDFSILLKSSKNSLSTNRLYTFYSENGDLFMGFDGFLAKRSDENIISQSIISLKSISNIDNRHILVGTSSFAAIIRKNDLSIVDTIRYGKCVSTEFQNGNYYLGGLDGLYKIDEKGKLFNFGSLYPELGRRIVSIKKGSGKKLYVATADKGLIILNNDVMEHVVNEGNGANSNICKSLFVDSNFLWLGTNKGINKISKDIPRQIVSYTTSDGLPSGIINDIVVKDSIVWVATPEGLTYFNENKIKDFSICKLMILDIKHNGGVASESGIASLPYKENSINFNFTAISLKSAGGMRYYYKLNEDSGFLQTTNTELTFLSLSPGKYHLMLFAENKFGKKSGMFHYEFFVVNPFWRNWWFYLLIIIFAAALTSISIIIYNKQQRKKIELKNRFQRQLASLEQQALQAQMNPHFIFNCLNSIQQFVITNKREKANNYLLRFSELIRETIEISKQPVISINAEITYLEKYLEMEKMRFGDDFKYEITVDLELMVSEIKIPSLLLQPYVENAIRHGLRYKEDEKGIIQLKFNLHKGVLNCHVIDNGIGRQKSWELKAAKNIEYQSKGMLLTAKRIRLINLIENTELQTEILDHVDENNESTGTEVIVKIPVFNSFIQQ